MGQQGLKGWSWSEEVTNSQARTRAQGSPVTPRPTTPEQLCAGRTTMDGPDSNLLEGAGVPMYLVVVRADLRNDPGHSDEDTHIDLHKGSNGHKVRAAAAPAELPDPQAAPPPRRAE